MFAEAEAEAEAGAHTDHTYPTAETARATARRDGRLDRASHEVRDLGQRDIWNRVVIRSIFISVNFRAPSSGRGCREVTGTS